MPENVAGGTDGGRLICELHDITRFGVVAYRRDIGQAVAQADPAR